MTRVVLDTNVLVSGMINAFGPPGRIVDLVREGHLQLVVDDRILAEYKDVLRRPKFRRYFTVQDASDTIAFLEHNTHYVVSTRQASDLPDPDDVPFLEVALTASVSLITGNIDDFPAKQRRSARVMTPARFLQERGATLNG